MIIQRIVQLVVWLCVGITSNVCWVVAIRIGRDELIRRKRLSNYFQGILENSVRTRCTRETEHRFFLEPLSRDSTEIDPAFYQWFSHSRHPYYTADFSDRTAECEAVDDRIREALLRQNG